MRQISFLGVFMLLLQFSCDTDANQNNLNLLHPEEEILIGTWQEIATHTVHNLDSNGNIIDSFDISATYEFVEDFTFYSQDEYWTRVTHGTWAFDSTFTTLFIYPIDDLAPGFYRKDRWEIVTLTPNFLDVGHIFDHIFPNGGNGAIYFRRKFEKID